MTPEEEWRQLYVEFTPAERREILQQAIRLQNNTRQRTTLAQTMRSWYFPALCLVLSILVILAAAIAPPADNKGQLLFDTLWGCMVIAVFAYTIASRLGILKNAPKEPLRTIALAQIFAIIALGISFPLLPRHPFAAIMFVLSFTSIAMFANATTAIILSTTIQKYRFQPTM